MKTKTFLFLFLFLSISLFSQNESNVIQSAEKIDLETLKYDYCQIVGRSANLLGTKVNISIDYGQERKWSDDLRVKDESGKAVTFNSMIDALNFMGEQGWEFVQAYAITMGNSHVYHFLLKKSKAK